MKTLSKSSKSVKSAPFSFSDHQLKSPEYYLQAHEADSQLGLDFQAPRPCNTGVQIPVSGKSCKVDWLEFTLKNVSPAYVAKEYCRLDFDLFVLADYGLQGYTDCYVLGNCKILHSPNRAERGAKLILSSQALDEVGQDAIDIIKAVLRDGGTFARIDVAVDDFTGSITIAKIKKAVREGNITTHFQEVQPVEKFKLNNGKRACLISHGVNFGSRSSGRFVRAYDKRLQQKHVFNIETPEWVRIELQANKRSALALAVRLASDGASIIPSVVAGALDFRLRTDDVKSDRAVRLPWWDKYLEGVQAIKTGLRKVAATIESKITWVSTQVSKTLGQVVVACGKDIIADVILTGIQRTKPKEWKMLFPERNIDSLYVDVQAGLAPVPF